MIRLVPLVTWLLVSGLTSAGPVPPARPAPVPHTRPTQSTRTAQPATAEGSASTATGGAHRDNPGRLVDDWPLRSQEIALRFIAEYGQPDAWTRGVLVWEGNGPWKRTEVFREGVEHAFPAPHMDYVEQTVVYQVPPDRFDDLAGFDGSVRASRTLGELASRSDSEEANFLALNLAVQVAEGRMTVATARAKHVELTRLRVDGKPPKETQILMFQQPRRAADPDQAPVPEQVTGW